MQTDSIWLATANRLHCPKLTKNIKVDIAIIGGGITGITTALALQQSGMKVAIFEAHEVGQNTTGFSTANLYAPVMQSHKAIQNKFNKQIVKTMIQSRQYAVDYIEDTVRQLGINCRFTRRPLYLFTQDDKKVTALEAEANILCQAGLDITATESFPLPFEPKKSFIINEQARFNPYSYLISIAQHLTSHGCRIFEHTRILKIEEKQDHCIAYTSNGKISARKVIMATHIPIGFNMKQMLAFPYRSYVVGMKLNQHQYPLSHFWDFDQSTSISTHNVFNEACDTLLIAGSSHKVGQPKLEPAHCHYESLKAYGVERFKTFNMQYCWSAQHYQSADSLPYIGLAKRSSKNIYMATGYATDGLTYGTLAGLLLADLIQGKTNPWQKVYDANRFTPIASAPKAIKENINVSCQYLKDYPGHVEAKVYADIATHEAKKIELDGEKWAAYRDDNNKLHIVSAICPHMKCVVNWNESENSWDCPCHGSRFTIDGDVIEGPALHPLKKYAKHEKKSHDDNSK